MPPQEPTHAHPPQPTPQLPSAERIDAFKKNLAYLWSESLELTGLPIDVLIAQVFKNAGQQGLAVSGQMIDFGTGASLAPSKETIKVFLDAFFARAMAAPNTMPEA